jgi:hypothetical protein
MPVTVKNQTRTICTVEMHSTCDYFPRALRSMLEHCGSLAAPVDLWGNLCHSLNIGRPGYRYWWEAEGAELVQHPSPLEAALAIVSHAVPTEGEPDPRRATVAARDCEVIITTPGGVVVTLGPYWDEISKQPTLRAAIDFGRRSASLALPMAGALAQYDLEGAMALASAATNNHNRRRRDARK